MKKKLSFHSPIHTILLMVCFLLAACHASKDPRLYILNPNPLIVSSPKNQQAILIGIDNISLPEYLENPQLMIFSTDHQSTLLEHDQWAEPLSNNIQRLIQTNLITQLPNAAVESAPWGGDFYPQYHLRLEISQFKVTWQGSSTLRAIYTIETANKVIHQHQIQLHEQLSVVTPTTAVISMNHLINRLSDKIAAAFKRMI